MPPPDPTSVPSVRPRAYRGRTIPSEQSNLRLRSRAKQAQATCDAQHSRLDMHGHDTATCARAGENESRFSTCPRTSGRSHRSQALDFRRRPTATLRDGQPLRPRARQSAEGKPDGTDVLTAEALRQGCLAQESRISHIEPAVPSAPLHGSESPRALSTCAGRGGPPRYKSHLGRTANRREPPE